MGGNPGQSSVPEAKAESVPAEGLELPCNDAAGSNVRDLRIVD